MGRLKDAWHALRGYAAAQDSRASNWAASGGSATAEVGAAAPTVARRARDAVRNDPYAGRIVDLWTGNAVGAGSHAAFARRALEAAAVGTGLTYVQVAGDLTQANYSSLRAGKIEFRRLCEQVQYGMLIPMLVRPIAERFHAQGALLGLWGGEMPQGMSFVPPAHEMIDPLKDTTALIAQVRAGFVPQAEAVGAFGYDFRHSVELIREANDLLDEAGLALDTDARRVAKSGAAQDAAQLAAIEIAATGPASAGPTATP